MISIIREITSEYVMQIILHYIVLNSWNQYNYNNKHQVYREEQKFQSGIYRVNGNVRIAEEETNIQRVVFIYLEYEEIV